MAERPGDGTLKLISLRPSGWGLVGSWYAQCEHTIPYSEGVTHSRRGSHGVDTAEPAGDLYMGLRFMLRYTDKPKVSDSPEQPLQLGRGLRRSLKRTSRYQ
eukprot:210403-Prymnesium_polylepis.4